MANERDVQKVCDPGTVVLNLDVEEAYEVHRTDRKGKGSLTGATCIRLVR